MTQPVDPTTLTDAELDMAIVDAARAYIAARLARPRDDQRIADAKTALDALVDVRDQRASVNA